MKDVKNRDDVETLMADIVQYERAIGELIERNDALSSKISHHERQEEARFETGLENIGSNMISVVNSVMRLAAQQSRNTDAILRLLGEVRLQQLGVKNVPTELAEALSVSDSYVTAIESVLSGQSVEDLQEARFPVEKEMSVKAVRSELRFAEDLDVKGRMAIVMRETREEGVHSMVFPLTGVPVNGLRGVSLEILGRDIRVARLRLRQAKALDNFTEVNIDLETGRYAGFRASHLEHCRQVTVRPLQNGWKAIAMEALLSPGDGDAELEVIALGSTSAVSSKRKGSGKDAFAIRSLRAIHSGGLTARKKERKPPPQSAPTVLEHSVRMPAEERRRAEKRAAYLASGAYTSLRKFKNAHKGRRAFIIGNGPSINDQDLTLLKDEITFVTNWFVNHPQYTEIDPTYYCVSSHEMFGGWNAENPRPNPDWLEKMLTRAGATHKFFSSPFRECLIGTGLFAPEKCDFLLFDRPKYQVDLRGDINLDLTQPMDDGYTGIITFCLPLAHFMGIEQIYLLGCDCDYGPIKGGAPKSYFYDFAQHSTRTTSEEGLLRVWAEDGPVFKSYEIVRDRFSLDGVQIINSTRGGRLEVFPRVAYESLVEAKK